MKIEFFNNSGSTIPSYALMWIKGTIAQLPSVNGGASVTVGRRLLEVSKLATTFPRYCLINGPSSVPDKGRGVTDDQYPKYCLIDTTSPTFDQGLGPTPNSWMLTVNGAGNGFSNIDTIGALPINGLKAAGTFQRTLIRQTPVTQVLGKLTEDLLASPDSDMGAQFKIYSGQPGIEADAGWDSITVYDWMTQTGNKILSGTRCVVSWINGFWYVTEVGACPVPV